jgi:hypothetical protein
MYGTLPHKLNTPALQLEDEYRNLKLLTDDDILLRAKQLAVMI